MLTQLWEVTKTVFVASYRKNIITASWLIMLPLLLAAWLFEISNPGFQSGFIIDAGGSLMALLAVILLFALALEHLFWPMEQSTPWFFLSRLKSRILLPAGKYLGIVLVLLFSLLIFAFSLFLLIGFNTGTWSYLPFKISVMVWVEYSLLLSILVLFSTFFSRLMSIGMMIPVFFVAHSVQYLRSLLPNGVAEIILAFLPDAAVFNAVVENNSLVSFGAAMVYGFFMSLFYITLAGYRMRSIDL